MSTDRGVRQPSSCPPHTKSTTLAGGEQQVSYKKKDIIMLPGDSRSVLQGFFLYYCYVSCHLLLKIVDKRLLSMSLSITTVSQEKSFFITESK